MEFPPHSVGDNIFLADFGLSLKAGTSVRLKEQGVLWFVAPECFHDYDPSPASDVWGFMVVFFYLYTRYLPFITSPRGNGESCLDSMVGDLGSLPESWAERRCQTYNQSWYRPSKEFPPDRMGFQSVTMRINEGGEDAGEVDNEVELRREVDKHAVELIHKVFRYLPEERPTTSQLLEDYDFKELMRKYGVA